MWPSWSALVPAIALVSVAVTATAQQRDASDPRPYYPGVFAGRDSFSRSVEMNQLRKLDMFKGFNFGLLPAYIAMDVPFRRPPE